MSLIQSTILGILQGFCEFLPISSSGHLVILPAVFGWQDQGLSFDVVLHLGTFLAVLFLFRKEWLRIIKSLVFWKNPEYTYDRRLTLLIIIGIIPAAILGLFLNDLVKNQLRLPLVVGINLIFWGIVLGIADWYLKKIKNEISKIKNISKTKALIIGLFQAVSLIPGSSRSGLSITGGLFSGLDRRTAVRFSFLMSAPLIFGTGIFKGIEMVVTRSLNIAWFNLVIGFLAAFLSGLLAIKLLSYIASRQNFLPFVAYRILIGILILIFLI